MQLRNLEYQEHVGDPKEWTLAPTEFTDITLVVGKNASGKSRLLNVLGGLANLLSGRRQELWDSGTYKAKFVASSEYEYGLQLLDKKVCKESLRVDGKQMFTRGEEGSGTIFMEDLEEEVSFKSPTDSLVVATRRDEFQHPWLERLHEWGELARHYHFGSDFGRESAIVETGWSEAKQPNPLDEKQVLRIYSDGCKRHGDDFRNLVLNDFRNLGYEIEDIALQEDPNIQTHGPIPGNLKFLLVKEKGIQTYINQLVLSTGMYRALALIIHLAYNQLEQKKPLVLIDDIGEGLDFERSRALISLVIDKATRHFVQIVMTTNDRFVMNEVPIDCWAVIHRDGPSVRLITPTSDPEVFSKFENIGLSNFDFFSKELFLSSD